MSSSAFLILIPFQLIALAAVIILQIFLSRRKSAIFGIILPIFYGFLLIPMIALIGLFTFRGATFHEESVHTEVSVIDADQEIPSDKYVDKDFPEAYRDTDAFVAKLDVNYVAIVFIVLNTIVLLGITLIIFFICRALMKKKAPQLTVNPNKEIDKMNILDLE
ncbi:MAG: hypothetical protein FWD34_01495 [Oscillospiraceae bacterium]|nr:hypothetical protein [Oscillospiraceae bacterium]